MKLDVADLARLSTLLDQALDVPPAERGAWLAALDAQVAHLGPTLRELLAKDSARDGSDLIDRMPVFTIAAEAAGSASFKAGDAVGPYRLLRELGRGGMGEVWLAERSDGHLKRPVALKLPMLSARRSVLVQRFARERDIVGSLAHPHIARLYDAGLADDGQPYLALEYIEGKPITTFCDEAALDVRARIALLRQVMDAVQYAHANLVVHRDLKPSNVLVTADGKAMLLDFGIAKLLQGDQTEAGATELTQLGGRALTPDYAAPEQLTGAPVSIATDVYALGLLLCESLTGQRAFTATNRSALEHAILNDEPARPSQRKAGALSALRRGAAGELDTIVLKALKKAPAERYPTVNAFADDLDRFVRGEAVLAQPDRLVYRLRKFVTRHRVPVVIGSAVAVALLATSALALVQAIEARRQATTAQQETKRAQAVQAFMTDLFQANTTHQDDPAAAQRVTARELLDRGAARVDEALRDEPQSRFEVMRTLADMYWQLSLDTEAAAIEGRRADLARQIYDKRDPRLATTLLEYAETISETEHRDKIPLLVDEAMAVLDATGDRLSPMRGQALVIAAEYWSHVSLARSLRLADEAVAFLQLHHPQSDRLVQAHMRAARGRMYRGELDDGVRHSELSIAAAQRKPPEVARSYLWSPVATLADALSAQLKLDQAEARLRTELQLATQVHGEEHARTVTSKARLGNLLQEIGRSDEGAALHEAARRALGPGGPRMEEFQRQFVLGILGLRLLDRGRPDLLVPVLRADIEELRRTIPRSGVTILRLRLWALMQATLGQTSAAESTYAEAQSLWNTFAKGAESAAADSAFALLRAQLDLAAGQAGDALVALSPARVSVPRDALNLHVARSRALIELGRPDEATEAAQSLLQALSKLPDGYRLVAPRADAHLVLGRAKLAKGDARAAEGDLRTALDIRTRHDAADSLWVAEAQTALAMCQIQLGQTQSARSLVADARRIHSVLGQVAAPQRAALERAQLALRPEATVSAKR